MDIEQERKRFEAWYRQEHPGQVCEWVSGSEKHGSGYTNNHTKELWGAWQSRAAECRVPNANSSITEILRLRDCLESIYRNLKCQKSAIAVAIKATCESGLGYRPQPEQETETDSKPCCKNYLPYITDEMFEEFGETDLMTWDRERNRPHWTQTAVDFAAELNVSGIHPKPPEQT